MTNILNSLSEHDNNIIAAKKLRKDSQNLQFAVHEAPQSMYKYSLSKALEEKDEFRKNVLQSNYEKKETKKKNIGKIAVVAAITGSLLLFNKIRKH